MIESRVSDEQLEKLRKMAGGLRFNLLLGVVGVFLSFFENSPAWTWFIVTTAWLGAVMGMGGVGYADHLLQRNPPRRQTSKGVAFLMSLVMFWIPTLGTAVFGLALAGALREGLQPQSRIDDKSFLLILQVFSMYFISAGLCWSIVRSEVKLEQQRRESSTADS